MTLGGAARLCVLSSSASFALLSLIVCTLLAGLTPATATTTTAPAQTSAFQSLPSSSFFSPRRHRRGCLLGLVSSPSQQLQQYVHAATTATSHTHTTNKHTHGQRSLAVTAAVSTSSSQNHHHNNSNNNNNKRNAPFSALSKLVRVMGGAAPKNGGGNGDASIWNLPNILTLMRVFSIPVLIAIFYKDVAWRNTACCALFVFAAMTDWLDGYLARRMNLSSPLGAFLDPVADKLMVATALVLMADRLDSPLVTISTCIIICREIGVSALREWMASQGARDTVAVGWWGKVKTATQMVALSVLLYVQPPLPTNDGGLAKNLQDGGVGLLVFSAFLTITSAVGYVKAAWPALTGGGEGSKKK